MTKNSTDTGQGQRGPTDHAIREQIVLAANQHFRHFGYGKTTVSDLAKAIGFSKAYIYKFFESKQAIGEVICRQSLGVVLADVRASVDLGSSASEKLRRMFRATTEWIVKLFFTERQLYDITVYSHTEKWASSVEYNEAIRELLEQIILEGRQAGEFERKTALDEACRASLQAMQSFINPVMLQYNLDLVPDISNEVIGLILRSLAP